MSLQALGQEQFGAMIERLAELAIVAAQHIQDSVDLELIAPPEFAAVVFRFRAGAVSARHVNERIPQVLFAEGRAVVGHTIVRGEPALKLTLCNPGTENCHIHELLDTIATCGKAIGN